MACHAHPLSDLVYLHSVGPPPDSRSGRAQTVTTAGPEFNSGGHGLPDRRSDRYHHARFGGLAWCWLAIRGVGVAARPVPGHQPGLETLAPPLLERSEQS